MDPHLKELEQHKHKLELIKIARELLNEEYINRRAQDHNRWLAESDKVWRTSRTKLPYPPFASYPTDDEIVAKATNLYKFVNSPPANTATNIPEVTLPELTSAEMAAASHILPESSNAIQESPWKTYLTPDTEDKTVRNDIIAPIEPSNILETETKIPVPATLESTELTAPAKSQTQINPTVSAMQSLLPGWVRRAPGG